MTNIYFPVIKLKPGAINLLSEQIHIWAADLEQDEAVISSLKRLLSRDELVKAGQFFLEKDSRYFITGRGILKSLLGIYLKTDPSLLTISYSKYGKPYLPISSNNEQLYFNIAHSGNVALFAFLRDREIGIDIEYIHEIREMDDIARNYFSSKEFESYSHLPEGYRTKPFFNCWTMKEAFIKAIGEGFSRPLHKFDVSFLPSVPARLNSINGDYKAAAEWTIKELKPAQGYAAAFAVELKKWELQCWLWDAKLLRGYVQKTAASLSSD